MEACNAKSGSWVEGDLLFNDMGVQKLGFGRNLCSLAGELKNLKSQLTSQELSFTTNTLTIKYLKELDNVKLKLATTQTIAEASSAAAQSALYHCIALSKDLEVKDISLKEHGYRVNNLEEQLALLQKEILSREISQDIFKTQVSRIESEITQALVNALANYKSEITKVLEVVSSNKLEQIKRHLEYKDDKIANLKTETGFLSAGWMIKSKELELQLEKQRKADQGLKKRVLKLEFSLQETRAQTRKLKRMGKRRDKAMKELQDLVLTKKKYKGKPASDDKQKIWERPVFNIMASTTMLIFVVFSKK